MGPRNHVLDGIEIPRGRSGGKEPFSRLSDPLKGIGSLCCGVCSKMKNLVSEIDRSVVNNVMLFSLFQNSLNIYWCTVS